METTPPTTGPAPRDATAKTGGHVLAFLAGIFILLVSTAGSLGASLLAPIGMVIASGMWERRGRRLSAAGHWIAALSGAAIIFVLFAGVVSSLAEKKSFDRMKEIVDSTQKAAAKESLPAWFKRIAPAMAARQGAARPRSERMQTVSIAIAAGFSMIFFVGFYGSLAWAGGMLVGYSVNGQWPGAAARAPAGNANSSLS